MTIKVRIVVTSGEGRGVEMVRKGPREAGGLAWFSPAAWRWVHPKLLSGPWLFERMLHSGRRFKAKDQEGLRSYLRRCGQFSSYRHPQSKTAALWPGPKTKWWWRARWPEGRRGARLAVASTWRPQGAARRAGPGSGRTPLPALGSAPWTRGCKGGRPAGPWACAAGNPTEQVPRRCTETRPGSPCSPVL